MLKRCWNWLVSTLNFSVVIGGLGDIFALWQRSSARDRAIITVVFAPMFLCIGGLVFSIVSFVIFVLPSFLIRLIGWLALIVLFGMGGKYLYEKMTGKPNPSPFSSSSHEDGSFTDVSYTEVSSKSEADGREEIRQRWYERVKNER